MADVLLEALFCISENHGAGREIRQRHASRWDAGRKHRFAGSASCAQKRAAARRENRVGQPLRRQFSIPIAASGQGSTAAMGP